MFWLDYLVYQSIVISRTRQDGKRHNSSCWRLPLLVVYFNKYLLSLKDSENRVKHVENIISFQLQCLECGICWNGFYYFANSFLGDTSNSKHLPAMCSLCVQTCGYSHRGNCYWKLSLFLNEHTKSFCRTSCDCTGLLQHACDSDGHLKCEINGETSDRCWRSRRVEIINSHLLPEAGDSQDLFSKPHMHASQRRGVQVNSKNMDFT